MRWLIIAAALTSACGGSSTGPSAPPASTAPISPAIETTPCPLSGPPDLNFYRQIACNGFETPAHLEPVRRWMITPKLYLRTVDEAGTPIDAVTLETVQAAMIQAAPLWTNNRVRLEVTRGTESREGASGWITVKWPAPDPNDFLCGFSQRAVDGGWIELHYAAANCAGCNGSRVRPDIAKHELGHALGYYHSDPSSTDLMCQMTMAPCDQQPSARELQAASYQYGTH